jgi:hypothetical protein
MRHNAHTQDGSAGQPHLLAVENGLICRSRSLLARSTPSDNGDPLEGLTGWCLRRVSAPISKPSPDETRKSSAGTKPLDAILMFRMLVLQSLSNLSDEQVEYQVRDQLSFTPFLRVRIEIRIPDGTTLWLFRDKLAAPDREAVRSLRPESRRAGVPCSRQADRRCHPSWRCPGSATRVEI